MNILSSVVRLADLDVESEKISRQSRHLAQLIQAKFPLLPGFVITSNAYFDFLQENKLDHKIKQLLSTVSFDLPDSLMQIEHHIKRLFSEAKLSPDFITKLQTSYNQLGTETITITLYGTDPQGKKYISKYIDFPEVIAKHIKDMWAELFAAQALWHRNQLRKDYIQIGAEILIQKKINTDKRGVVITIDPLNHSKDKMTIIMYHPHTDDHYILSKKNLSVIDQKLNQYTNIDKLSLDEMLHIGKIAKEVEKYLYFPQEITWVIEDDTLYIIDVRPVSSIPQQKSEKKSKLPIAHGKGITTTIGTGHVRIIQSLTDLQKTNSHNVIIIREMTANQIKHVKKARAVIIRSTPTNKEIEILLKHYGIPTISTTELDSKSIHNGHIITVHGGKGEIYQGGFF